MSSGVKRYIFTEHVPLRKSSRNFVFTVGIGRRVGDGSIASRVLCRDGRAENTPIVRTAVVELTISTGWKDRRGLLDANVARLDDVILSFLYTDMTIGLQRRLRSEWGRSRRPVRKFSKGNRRTLKLIRSENEWGSGSDRSAMASNQKFRLSLPGKKRIFSSFPELTTPCSMSWRCGNRLDDNRAVS